MVFLKKGRMTKYGRRQFTKKEIQNNIYENRMLRKIKEVVVSLHFLDVNCIFLPLIKIMSATFLLITSNYITQYTFFNDYIKCGEAETN